jgi:hypothetical protein
LSQTSIQERVNRGIIVKSLSIWIALLAAPLLGITASAHHSHAMFDTSKRISIAGTVKEFQFTNPHSWLIVVNEVDGSLWSFETGSPSQLLRKGIKLSTFPGGTKLTVNAMPLRDGRAGGQAISVTMADGRVVPIEPEGYTGPVQ